MKHFVAKNSIVRTIWGRADTVLFIFAGAAAEFALNKAVDWLYFTGKLPADPLGRLFSTVTYARHIIFQDEDAALKAIDNITAIHKNVEHNRGTAIPDWAYRDVLFLLIDYSIRSFELLDRELTGAEKAEVFEVFYRVGLRMGLKGLPISYTSYCIMRADHLQNNLAYSHFSADLYHQYRVHLGWLRFLVLKQVQLLLVPAVVSAQLPLGSLRWIRPILSAYRLLRGLKFEKTFRNALLPAAYKKQVLQLDRIS